MMHESQVTIHTPCDVEWSTLERRAKGRFCGHCNKLVHDLSSLSEREARKVLASVSETLCVRYLHDETGEIYFAERLVPPKRLTRGRAGALAIAAPLLIQACGGADFDPSEFENCAPTASSAPTQAFADAGPPAPVDPNTLPPCPEFGSTSGANPTTQASSAVPEAEPSTTTRVEGSAAPPTGSTMPPINATTEAPFGAEQDTAGANDTD